MNWAEEEGKPSPSKGEVRTGGEEVPERETPPPRYEEEGLKGGPDMDPLFNQAKGLGSEFLREIP